MSWDIRLWEVDRCTAGVNCRKWLPTTLNTDTRPGLKFRHGTCVCSKWGFLAGGLRTECLNLRWGGRETLFWLIVRWKVINNDWLSAKWCWVHIIQLYRGALGVFSCMVKVPRALDKSEKWNAGEEEQIYGVMVAWPLALDFFAYWPVLEPICCICHLRLFRQIGWHHLFIFLKISHQLLPFWAGCTAAHIQARDLAEPGWSTSWLPSHNLGGARHTWIIPAQRMAIKWCKDRRKVRISSYFIFLVKGSLGI